MDPVSIIILSVILVCVLLDWVSDRYRIQSEVEAKGGRIKKIKWRPFGPGGDWDMANRFYMVDYIDSQGKAITRYCKTSYKGGTYWKD